MKYIEAPDIHFDPAWAEVTETAINAIVEAARTNAVNFVAFPGDIYNRAIQASDKGGLNVLRGLIRRVTDVCPAVAVYGTPSHEPPGSLENLEDCGLFVLRPGKVYGYWSTHRVVSEIGDKKPATPTAVLFGIPELNKQSIQSQLGLPADEANAEAVNLLRQYITEFVAPMRQKYAGIPAIGLLHGNVSDSSRDNETDIVLRASDIVIHTDDLLPANVNRWSIGHIHTPWESENISAGYAGFTGMDGNPWGKCGFVPGMNLVDISAAGATPDITRIPYGTPERRQIQHATQAVNSDVAYWLRTDDPDAVLPDTVHPWSRVTIETQRQESRRVTREQAETVKSLRDLFKLFDPDVTEDVLKLVDTMQESTRQTAHQPIDVHVDSVIVQGCVFFKGRTAVLDTAKLPPGLTGIRGNNGAGKSSLLAFCSPYPTVVGKDTKSGRTSAIKDFFTERDSMIKKSLTVNGHKHEHVITIRGAHTQSPKTECYLSTDGVPQMETASFDEMFAKCEELYGPYNDYLLTSFYVQPLQGKTGSSLMSATMTDIRDLVQNIAGIDREAEKRYALDAKTSAQTEYDKLSAWLAGAREFQIDIPALEAEIKDVVQQLESAQKRRDELAASGKSKRVAYDEQVARQRASADEQRRQSEDESRGWKIATEIQQKKNLITELQSAASELAANEKRLADDDAAREKNRERQALREENTRLQREYDDIERRLKTQIDNNRQQISMKSEYADKMIVACQQCGYIDPESAEKAAVVRAEIEVLESGISDTEEQLASLETPAYATDILDDEPVLQPAEREALQAAIRSGIQAESEIQQITARIAELQHESKEIESREYQIIPGVDEQVAAINTELEALREQHRTADSEVSRLTTQRDSRHNQLTKAREVQDQIEDTEQRIQQHASERDAWDYIARALQPSKIPAMELDIVLDTIDEIATRVIAPVDESRYSFRTITQREGKKSTVDDFDILVHDAEAGREKSFLAHSPGEKAFFADAYVKALIQQRNERAQRHYDPVVMDESDGPIQPERVASYYEMQTRYWTDSRVLVVSHSPASHEHIENTINVEELMQ